MTEAEISVEYEKSKCGSDVLVIACPLTQTALNVVQRGTVSGECVALFLEQIKERVMNDHA